MALRWPNCDWIECRWHHAWCGCHFLLPLWYAPVGGCDSVIAARCYVAWENFRKLLPVLTSKHLSPRIHGKVYKACVHSDVLHGSETKGTPSCSGSATMTMPSWSIGSVPSKTETKHPQIHYYRNLASRTFYWSLTVGDTDGMAMYNRPCPVSKLSQTFRFSALERKEGPRRHGLNVWRLMSVSMA